MAEGPLAQSAEELLLAQERRGVLLEAIPAIPEQLRQALLARFYEERDYDGVAADLGISTATARTRVHRALSRLRGAMAKLRAIIPAPSILGAYSTPANLLPALLTIAVITLDANPQRDAPVGGPVHVALGPAPGRYVHKNDTAPSSRSRPADAAAPSGPAPTHAKTERRTTTAGGSAPVPATPAAEAPKRFDFDDDDIEAESDRPEFEFLVGDDRPAAHHSLIDVPRSLVASLLKALEDL